MNFLLGVHMPQWLSQTSVPLFVSRTRLERYRNLPRARSLWHLDSGAFTELSTYGRWTITPTIYAHLIRRFSQEIGKLSWAAPMDWMCEPFILAKTSKSIRYHQDATIDNYGELTSLVRNVQIIPVLQGFLLPEYLSHCELYARRGINLRECALVGIGSICRRQGTKEIQEILRRVSSEGISLHGFGVKIQGLSLSRAFLASCDSMAWSFDARRSPPLSGCTHRNCANCLKYALKWRKRAVSS